MEDPRGYKSKARDAHPLSHLLRLFYSLLAPASHPPPQSSPSLSASQSDRRWWSRRRWGREGAFAPPLFGESSRGSFCLRRFDPSYLVVSFFLISLRATSQAASQTAFHQREQRRQHGDPWRWRRHQRVRFHLVSSPLSSRHRRRVRKAKTSPFLRVLTGR